MRARPYRGGATAVIGLLLLGGCTVGPKYAGPPRETTANLPARFKNAPPPPSRSPGRWRPAHPDEQAAGGSWWRVFGDPDLNRMEDQSLAGNQDVRQAVLRIDQARAQTRLAAADLYPNFTTDAAFVRQRTTSTGAVRSAPFRG